MMKDFYTPKELGSLLEEKGFKINEQAIWKYVRNKKLKSKKVKSSPFGD